MKKIICVLLIITFILFTGCTQQLSKIQIDISSDDPKIISHHDMGRYSIDVVRFSKSERTCFVMEGIKGGGISCL